MASSPNQSPPGKQYELRVSASNLEFDRLLAELTLPAMRARLPGFLFLFSEQQFELAVTDRDRDGRSEMESRFKGMQMRVTKFNRNKFSLDSEVSKHRESVGDKDTLLGLRLNLGIQAASEMMLPPYFAVSREQTLIPFTYTIPHPVRTRTMGVAFKDLQDYLAESPRGIVDELTLVESALRNRRMRDRQRPDVEPVIPIPFTQPDEREEGELSDDLLSSAV